jgi:hypothetical protein
MSAVPLLTPDIVREYLRDSAGNNHLIDGEEFSDIVINLAMDLACSEYNLIPPGTAVDRFTFPNKALLMSGTLYKMFAGQSALLARNTMQYSDGGIQIPVEERFALYQSLAAMYQNDFQNGTRVLKTSINLENGWGEVRSDYASMPVW